MKKILSVNNAPRSHWVGDGFPVRSMFSYDRTNIAQLSPFLLLDYAGPASFEPTSRQRGVGQHPHRGFETVTIVYQGEVAHKDSTGAGGLIGPGDVQWMTAGGGILHEEFHSEAFARNGGMLEMVQLWVNLPAKEKMAEPGYQTLLNVSIPSVNLPNGAGLVRVIAGQFDGHSGPAKTFTPIDVWDVRLNRGGTSIFHFADGRTLVLMVLHGTVLVNGSEIVEDSQLVEFAATGSEIAINATSDATLLLLSGTPINEPIVGHGPFVMNSKAEIALAISDFHAGKFGHNDRMHA